MANQRKEPTFAGDRAWKDIRLAADRLEQDQPVASTGQPSDYAQPDVRNLAKVEAEMARIIETEVSPRLPERQAPPPFTQRVPDQEAVVQQAHSFLELPIQEIENTRTAVKEEIAVLDKEADEMIVEFETRIAHLKAGYERLRKGVGLSKEAFKTLREQCRNLDDVEDAKAVFGGMDAASKE